MTLFASLIIRVVLIVTITDLVIFYVMSKKKISYNYPVCYQCYCCYPSTIDH
jgi:hypothetical protein